MLPSAPAIPRPVLRTQGLGLLLAVLVLAGVPDTRAATLDITGPAGASVLVNGLNLRALPLDGPLTLAPGVYVVESEMEGFKPFKQVVRLVDDKSQVRLQIRFDPLSRRTAWTSSVLFAGLGQFYLGKPVRGWIYAAAEAGGLVAALAGELQRSDHRKDYLYLMDAYGSTINGDEATYYREQAEGAYAKMEDAESLRNTGLIVALAAIGVSVADALITFPNVEAGPGPVPPVSDYSFAAPGKSENPFTTAHVAVKLSF
jgi:hypothetical protein